MNNNVKKQTNENEKITMIEEYEAMIKDNSIYNYNAISSYHSQNNPWRDIKNGYGVELETKAPDNNTRDLLSRYLNYKLNMNIETDGSLGGYGMECISQPYTLKEWIDNKDTIKEFFDLMEHCNIKADNQTGLHIHISKKLIGKNDIIRENNINKLILILENFKDNFIKFSRRNTAYMNYCKFYSQSAGTKPFKDLYEIKRYKDYSHGHALNKDNKTYEIRIFKSTMNYTTFIATLQLVFNLVEIIKEEDLTKYTFNDIINYNKDFKELITYCKENGIKNGNKIIDKTKVKEILILRNNSRILKENYNYNKYITNVRNLIINNMELYKTSEEQYNEYNDIYDNLSYIFTQTYKNNNSIYYCTKEINKLLQNYDTKYITRIDNNYYMDYSGNGAKRVFNKSLRGDYKKLYNRLVKLIKEAGGEI